MPLPLAGLILLNFTWDRHRGPLFCCRPRVVVVGLGIFFSRRAHYCNRLSMCFRIFSFLARPKLFRVSGGRGAGVVDWRQLEHLAPVMEAPPTNGTGDTFSVSYFSSSSSSSSSSFHLKGSNNLTESVPSFQTGRVTRSRRPSSVGSALSIPPLVVDFMRKKRFSTVTNFISLQLHLPRLATFALFAKKCSANERLQTTHRQLSSTFDDRFVTKGH